MKITKKNRRSLGRREVIPQYAGEEQVENPKNLELMTSFATGRRSTAHKLGLRLQPPIDFRNHHNDSGQKTSRQKRKTNPKKKVRTEKPAEEEIPSIGRGNQGTLPSRVFRLSAQLERSALIPFVTPHKPLSSGASRPRWGDAPREPERELCPVLR